MSERSFADYMEYMYKIGKCETSYTLTIPELFDFSKQDVDRQVDEYARLFKVSGHGVTMLGFNETKIEIIKELERLKSEVSEEIFSRIELLIIASFRVGQDTESDLASVIIGGLKRAQVKKIYDGWELKNKENPVLVQAIKDVWAENPGKSAANVIQHLLDKAEGVLTADGYDISFQKKGTMYNGEVLRYDSFVCYPPDPPDIPKHGYKQGAVAPSTLKRYCTKIKKGEL